MSRPANVDSSYQLMCDKERRIIKPIHRFGYVNLISYALTTVKEQFKT